VSARSDRLTVVAVQDAEQLVQQRVDKLMALSWQEALRLPESAEERVSIAGNACALTTYRQTGVLPNPNAVLVTVQLARPRCFGVLGDVLEKGLVFEAGIPTRPATAGELLDSEE
jgi:hypothetical protein